MTEHPAQPWTARWRGMRRLAVLRAAAVTPGLRRITLGGPEGPGLDGGPNLKLLLPARPGVPLHLPPRGADGKPVWVEDALKPVIRTYTVSRIDPLAGELDIDFVLHGDEGVASAWAARARPGDAVGVAGLGGRTVRPAARTILAGDHTALPAITNILAALPPEARGEAFLQVPGLQEQVGLRHPPGVSVTWLHADPHSDALVRAVQALAIAPGEDVFAWVGTESTAARALRAHLRDSCGVDRRRMLVIGYWKLGMSETEYGRQLDHDRDADYHAVAREEAAGHNRNQDAAA